jgi:hypothetical protein
LGSNGGGDLDCGDASVPLRANFPKNASLASILISVAFVSNVTDAVLAKLDSTVADANSRVLEAAGGDRDALNFLGSKVELISKFGDLEEA